MHELLDVNPLFLDVLSDYLLPVYADDASNSGLPLPLTILTLSSYLLTHASSLSSARATAYAHLSLNILLALAQSEHFLKALSLPSHDVRQCRQRLPLLPVLPHRSPPLCVLLDCCVLWFRHNLHLRLEVQLYA
jgi:hypothetical protein